MLKFICQALGYLSGTFACSINSGVISIHVQNSRSDHGGHVIDIENRRGPNNDPCGTPLVTVNQSDATPLIMEAMTQNTVHKHNTYTLTLDDWLRHRNTATISFTLGQSCTIQWLHPLKVCFISCFT